MINRVNIKIILLRFVSLFVFVSFFIFIVSPRPVLSQTHVSTVGLQSKINSLLAQITSLQSQLGTLQSGTTTTTTTATGYTFTSNLKKGDKGADVLQLQKVLNSNPDTVVATTGVGSAGNETNYFGNLTKAAVIKFQNKYASDILTPLGLSAGTGYVGPSTRAKLNSMTTAVVTHSKSVSLEKPATKIIQINNKVVAKKVALDNSKVFPGIFVSRKISKSSELISKSNKLYIMFPSKYFGSVGTKVNLQGTGFSKNGNNVLFDNIYIAKDVIPMSNGSISFVIPSSINTGKYKVRVENKNGMSKNSTFFIVTDKTAVAPVVKEITPNVVGYGDFITIRGIGFTKENNTVRTSYSLINNLSSKDGKTITLSVTPKMFKKNINIKKKIEINFWITVENKDGVSNSAKFEFNI